MFTKKMTDIVAQLHKNQPSLGFVLNLEDVDQFLALAAALRNQVLNGWRDDMDALCKLVSHMIPMGWVTVKESLLHEDNKHLVQSIVDADYQKCGK